MDELNEIKEMMKLKGKLQLDIDILDVKIEHKLRNYILKQALKNLEKF